MKHFKLILLSPKQNLDLVYGCPVAIDNCGWPDVCTAADGCMGLDSCSTTEGCDTSEGCHCETSDVICSSGDFCSTFEGCLACDLDLPTDPVCESWDTGCVVVDLC